MKGIFIIIAMLICATAAESIRETETMDPNGMFDLMESSGSLPDDEDLDDYYDDVDSDSDEGSASGDDDEMDDLESTLDTPTTTMGNKIPENDVIDLKNDDFLQNENEIIPRKNLIPDESETSNEISMASTANSFFSKTEVIVALAAGALVGLLFAIFIIVLLVMRIRRNKGDLTYDAVKKPIYKKASTVEA
ncbi:syndecan 4-B-like [Rana temporaria]|uniref:syndecan 4-B-like n=1 Tax=Rana temporaria TaxID=8407 RepID=UPI001AAD4BB1|nr:syndecan 4-B-like [Rana temporaria]